MFSRQGCFAKNSWDSWAGEDEEPATGWWTLTAKTAEFTLLFADKKTNGSGKIVSSAVSWLLHIKREVIITVNAYLQFWKKGKNPQQFLAQQMIRDHQLNCKLKLIHCKTGTRLASTYRLPHRSHTVTNKTAGRIDSSLTLPKLHNFFSHMKIFSILVDGLEYFHSKPMYKNIIEINVMVYFQPGEWMRMMYYSRKWHRHTWKKNPSAPIRSRT